MKTFFFFIVFWLPVYLLEAEPSAVSGSKPINNNVNLSDRVLLYYETKLIKSLDERELISFLVYMKKRGILPLNRNYFLNHSNPKIRVASVSTFFSHSLSLDEKRELELLLHDKDLIVVLSAARYLRGVIDDEKIFLTIVNGLSSSKWDSQPFGDPPKPASIMAVDLLLNWEDKDKLLQLIGKYQFESLRIKYHLIDIEAVITGKIEKPIYYYVNDPTPEDVSKLDVLKDESSKREGESINIKVREYKKE